mgnify:CR=1 FL=1
MTTMLLAAQVSGAGDWRFWLVGGIALAAVILMGTLMLLSKCYVRCPSNRVLVIYGWSGKGHEAAVCIHGGARFIKPLVESYAWLYLDPMQIEIPLRGALSLENIRVNVPSVFTVAVGTTPELMQNAAIRLLGLSRGEIMKQAEDIIFGQLRQVIASMPIEDINRDRDKFLENIQSSLEPELKKIGLVLINVNITDITDESGYIEAIGQKAASAAIQKARGDVADNEKMGEIRVAEAEREKAISVANARKVREIGTREAMREQAVRIAAAAHIHPDGDIAMAGKIFMDNPVADCGSIALAVGEVFQYGRRRIFFCIFRHPDSSRQPRSICQWYPRVFDKFNRMGKLGERFEVR